MVNKPVEKESGKCNGDRAYIRVPGNVIQKFGRRLSI